MKHKFIKILVLALMITSVLSSSMTVFATSLNSEKTIDELSELSLEEIHNILYISDELGTIINETKNDDGKIMYRAIMYTAEEAIIYRELMDIYISRMTYAYEYLNRNVGLDYVIGFPFFDYEVVDGEFYIIIEEKNVFGTQIMSPIAAEKEKCFDIVKLDDGKTAFKAAEKVEDPEAVNFRLNQLKEQWAESVIRTEKILGEGYYENLLR